MKKVFFFAILATLATCRPPNNYGNTQQSSSDFPLFIVIIGIVVILILIRAYVLSQRPLPHTGHWHQHFENFEYLPSKFYETITLAIQEKAIPGVQISYVEYSEEGLFSMKRQYLRIKRNRMIFDICAAPFAKGFFVSWWHSSLPGFREVLIGLIPILGKTILRNRRATTFFEMDTEQMFRDSFHQSIMEAIEAITTAKGMRILAPQESTQVAEPV